MMRGFSLLVVSGQLAFVSGQLSVVICSGQLVRSPPLIAQLSVASYQ